MERQTNCFIHGVGTEGKEETGGEAAGAVVRRVFGLAKIIAVMGRLRSPEPGVSHRNT